MSFLADTFNDKEPEPELPLPAPSYLCSDGLAHNWNQFGACCKCWKTKVTVEMEAKQELKDHCIGDKI
jgi:hypothetical protein